MGGDKFAEATGGVKRGSIVTVAVTAIEDGGIEVGLVVKIHTVRKKNVLRGLKNVINVLKNASRRLCRTTKKTLSNSNSSYEVFL